jgi:hypothetical protein
MRSPTIAIVLFTVAPSGCDSRSPDPPPAPRMVTGHERMLLVLKELADWSRRDSTVFGDAANRKLTAVLASMTENTPPIARLRAHRALGFHELRLGRNREAVEHYEAAYRLLPRLEGETAAAETRATIFELGLAHMRWGETQNCVARHTSRSCIWPIEGSGVHQNQEGSKKAIQYFQEVLRADPTHLAARWLLNVATMTIGGYPDDVPAAHRIDPRRLRGRQGFPRFEDVAPNLGLNTFNLAGGAVVEDFNNDGLLDILTSTWDLAGPIQYFENDGGGSFTNKTAGANLEGIFGGLNLVQADYDNDGFVDVLLLRGAWMGHERRMPNSLLRNLGGRFRDVTFEAGLADVFYPSQAAGWADYDLDGDLDLYVGNEAAPDRPFPSQLFRNNGDRTFTDVAREAGVTNLRFAKGVSWGDYDGDRFPDLYVSNHSGENRLYHNEGNGVFNDVAPQAGVTLPLKSFPTWFWDFDNDGALDLYVSSYWYTEMKWFLEDFFGLKTEAERDRLYRGDGRGTFRDVTQAQGLGHVLLPMGANHGDLDNDGFLDFYLGTGFPGYEALVPNVMYRNRGGTGFTDVTTAGGFGHLQKGHGVAFADLDDDGDQDVFEQIGGAVPGDAFGNVLFENPGFGAHWIKLKLVGRRSNRSAIGTRIRLELRERGKRRSIYRHVSSGGSFGANPLRQEIGLGGAATVDVLEVFWPAGNTTQVFRDVAADRLVEIHEGDPTLRATALKPTPWRRPP